MHYEHFIAMKSFLNMRLTALLDLLEGLSFTVPLLGTDA
jgi:hypothetical protein